MHNDLLHSTLWQIATNAWLLQPIQSLYLFVIRRNI